jgi:2'-5' RNA ligase
VEPLAHPQDSQRFQPHVTIQNKVAPDEARALHRRLSAEFQPFTIRGEGLILWRYLGGPWERIRLFRFAA